MKAPIEKKPDNAMDSLNASQSAFNFELWAKQVRPQLLASVQKRGVK